ncbi:MAG: nucleotide exchange factor GrpE [Acidobacteriia bacterium]|nr:nucleotide exchange factor GrpE [Terriglobia bacterium]
MSRKPVIDPLEDTLGSNPEGNLDQAAVDPPAALEAITTERDRLAAENSELQDRFLRFQAEFQNFRKRVDKDRLELSEYASMEAVRTLLPIIDDFERALQTETADKTYAQGLDLIRQRLFDALKKLGLEPIIAQGEPFDPHIHHAVEMVETGDAPDHTVLAEFQRGYNFKGRLLRPAMVKVAVEPKRD